jgi:glucan 1,4-alpha-glucosidase
MKKTLFILIFISSLSYCQSITSPSQQIKLLFSLSTQGQPMYEVSYKSKNTILPSKLGIDLKDSSNLNQDFEIIATKNTTFNETWQPVLGEQANILNHYNELFVSLQQKKSNLKLNLVFRIFNDGIAFRYEFPKQENLNHFIILNENSEFNFSENATAFWIPGDFDSNEYVYNKTKISEIDTKKINLNNGIGMKSISGQFVVQSPIMMKSDSGIYLNIFEAAVINYPVMHLDVEPSKFEFKAHLVPNAIGHKAYLQTPCTSPWRTIMMSDDARDIVSSKMILNLNEPCKIKDISYIKPMKYVGVWWEMHVGKATWDYAGSQNAQNNGELKATGKHGATTQNTKRYIDFASKHGFDGVLVEGWNVGWEDWFGNWKENVFDFVSPYPDFDLKEISDYAKSKNIKMIMHHETSGSVSNYERHLDRAFNLMKKYDYPALKSGYVGKIIPRGEFHDGQTMVNHYNFVVQRAADYGFLVNSHESSRPTGYSRTYPNYICAEAARGNEFNAWSVGSPPSHETILPFTRLLGGPMDYTPGIFETKMSFYDSRKTEQIHSTLAKQLALYVTMYSPLQMAADLPENYEKYLDAFQFIKDVALDWDKSIYLEAEPGDYLTVARQSKGKSDWFIGAITNENERTTTLKFNFLDDNSTYEATIYKDGSNADWKENPKDYLIEKQTITKKSMLKLKLAKGGGAAIFLKKM